MTQLTKHSDLLEKVDEINKSFDMAGNVLAYLLAKVDAEEAYKELGFTSVHEYGINHLGKSKGNVSILLSVGKMILESEFQPETIETPYYKLYLARSENKNGFSAVLAHASTLSEQDLVVKKKAEKAGEHIPNWKKVCTVCGLDEYNHA